MTDSTSTAEQLEALRKQLETLSSQLHTAVSENDALRTQLQVPKCESVVLDAQVCKVAPKVPPFWHQKPAMWFAHIETQFRVAGITSDQTKYDHVISQLDFKITAEIEDIIINPPPADRYTHLKNELIRRFSQSEVQRVRLLLTEEELGDRKPTQFLRHLRSLAGNTLSNESILRQLFMRRMPQHLQAILAASTDSLDDIAVHADKILEVSPVTTMPSHQFVHATSSPTCSNSPDPFNLQTITTQLQQLSAHVAALSRDRSRSRSPAGTEGTRGQRKLCWYHRTYKSKALKCISPCSWKQGNQQASQ